MLLNWLLSFDNEFLKQLKNLRREILIDLSKLTADVNALHDGVSKAIGLLNSLKASVDALGAQVDPTLQAQVDALSAQIEQGTTDLAAAVTADTPVVPAPAPAANT